MRTFSFYECTKIAHSGFLMLEVRKASGKRHFSKKVKRRIFPRDAYKLPTNSRVSGDFKITALLVQQFFLLYMIMHTFSVHNNFAFLLKQITSSHNYFPNNLLFFPNKCNKYLPYYWQARRKRNFSYLEIAMYFFKSRRK